MVIPAAIVTYQPPVHKSIHLVQVYDIDNGVKIVQTMFSLYCTILTPLSILAQDEYSYGQVAGM